MPHNPLKTQPLCDTLQRGSNTGIVPEIFRILCYLEPHPREQHKSFSYLEGNSVRLSSLFSLSIPLRALGGVASPQNSFAVPPTIKYNL